MPQPPRWRLAPAPGREVAKVPAVVIRFFIAFLLLVGPARCVEQSG